MSDIPSRHVMGPMLDAAFRFRCPSCGRGGLFAGLYAVADTCPACEVRFERDEGSWTGSVVLGYAIAAVVALATGVAMFRTWGLFRGFEIAVAGAACVGALAGYRSAKGWWVWLLWVTGQVVTDESFDRERTE